MVVWISSSRFPYATNIMYFFHINLIQLLSKCLCITTARLLGPSRGDKITEVKIILGQRNSSYTHLNQSLGPVAKLQRSKSLSSANALTETWIIVYIQQEYCDGDQNCYCRFQDNNPHPAG